MKKLTKLLIVLIFFILIISCVDSGVSPDIQPGIRDYTWTIDTIEIPFTSLIRIWGSEPNDIWAIGPGGGLDQTIWHYDGIKWATDGISRPISPLSVWGFGKNNIWLGGGDGKIWHFDGIVWKEIVNFFRPREKHIGFQEMWGDSPSNIFATGYSGFEENRTSVIAHYDGSKWELIDLLNLKYNLLRIKRGIKTGSNYYLMGIKSTTSGGDIFGLFEYDGNKNIKQIFEGTISKETYSTVQQIDGKIYFVIGDTIYRYMNNEFKIFVNINNPNFYTQIFGRTEKDIFLLMYDGIAHYNGIDAEYIYKPQNRILIVDCIVFEKEVLFLALDLTNGGNLIIRGKLN